MATGIETAGLILASVPICISALEHYKKTKETWQRFRQKSLYLDRLIGALEEQKVLMEIDLKLLLRQLGYEDNEIVEVLESATGFEFLSRKDVAHEISQYLGEAHKPYQNALARCERVLCEIVKGIGSLTPEQNSSGDLKELIRANSGNQGRYEWTKRIKFSVKKDELDCRIDELNKATSMLSTLRITGTMLAEGTIKSTSRTNERIAKFLHRVRNHASSLYYAISKGCITCHPEHSTELYLESRTDMLHNKRSIPIRFRIVFSSNSRELSYLPYGYETEIDVLDAEQCAIISPHTTPFVSGRRVTIHAPPQSKSPLPTLTKLRELCVSIEEAAQNRKLLKLYLAESCFSYHQFPQGTEAIISNTRTAQQSITLAQILHEPIDLRKPSGNWTLHRRMKLALKLASSLVQLCTTPWLLVSDLAKSSIYFVQLQGPQLSGSLPLFDVDNPFVLRDFPDHASSIIRQGFGARDALLDLGILLLEIYHQTTFENYISTNCLPMDCSWSRRYEGARRWLDDTIENIPLLFGDAVSRCLECNFATDSSISLPAWDDSVFRQAVCEGVIGPLRQNCERN